MAKKARYKSNARRRRINNTRRIVIFPKGNNFRIALISVIVVVVLIAGIAFLAVSSRSQINALNNLVFSTQQQLALTQQQLNQTQQQLNQTQQQLNQTQQQLAQARSTPKTTAVETLSASTSVSPSSVYQSQPRQFIVVITNSSGSGGDSIHVASFTIPTGYSGISTTTGGYTVTASSKIWMVTGVPSGSSDPQTVTVTASSSANDIANGEWVQVFFTCTAPVYAGSTSWSSSVTGTLGGTCNPTAQTVTVQPYLGYVWPWIWIGPPYYPFYYYPYHHYPH